ETFRGSRGIKPLSAYVVYVRSLALVFDLPGIPYLEPRFANVKLIDTESVEVISKGDETTPLLETVNEAAPAEKAAGLYGVVYCGRPEDYAKIVATEGGRLSYADVLVDCVVVPKSERCPTDATSKSNSEPSNPDIAAGEKVIIKAHTLLAPKSKTR